MWRSRNLKKRRSERKMPELRKRMPAFLSIEEIRRKCSIYAKILIKSMYPAVTQFSAAAGFREGHFPVE